MPDFINIDYLRKGNAVQRKCYRVLVQTNVIAILSPFGPVVVGTIPVGVDIPGSDIDILCRTADFGALRNLLKKYFKNYPGFSYFQIVQRGIPALVCSFKAGNMEVEIFAQDVPVTEQNGYRHMVTEYELLKIYGDWLRRKVVELKLSGLKTEPAFSCALDLKGDPYTAVLEKGRELGVF